MSPEHPSFRGDDDVSVALLCRTLLRRRRVLSVIWASAVGLCVLAVMVAYLWVPRYTTAEVGFRALFDGADGGKYPNETPFSPSDVLALPVLEQVHEANGLNEYGALESFKAALVVSQTSTRLEQLVAEYTARLVEPRLSTTERQVIEREFAEKRASLSSSEFRLSLALNGRFRSMPRALADKVLTDIVTAYAEFADRRKGALKYRVAVPTRSAMPAGLPDGEDYIVSLDILRAVVVRLRAALSDLKAVPNAEAVRFGEGGLGLADVEARLDALNQFRLDPLIGFLRATGVSRDPSLAEQYLRSQLFRIGLKRRAAERKAAVYLEHLRTYVAAEPGTAAAGQASGAPRTFSDQVGGMPALIPQLGESFFDRLMEMGSSSDDMVYRQRLIDQATKNNVEGIDLATEEAYYDGLIGAFEGASRRSVPPAQRQAFRERFETVFPEIFQEVLRSVDDVNAFYGELSKTNLNPTALLVEMTEPVMVKTESSLSARSVALAAALYFFLVGLGSVIGVLIHARFRQAAGGAP